MHHTRLQNLTLLLSLGILATPPAYAADPSTALAYPKAPRSAQTDDYHGTVVADPFRPLENPDAPETRAWIDAENAVTRAWLEAVPDRAAIGARLTKLWN